MMMSAVSPGRGCNGIYSPIWSTAELLHHNNFHFRSGSRQSQICICGFAAKRAWVGLPDEVLYTVVPVTYFYVRI